MTMKTHLHLTLLNDLMKVDVEADNDFEDSFILTHESDDYPFCTIYKDSRGTYTVYAVINDIFRGSAIDDERKIGKNLTVNQAANTAKDLQKKFYKGDYPTILSTADGKNRQVEHYNQRGEL